MLVPTRTMARAIKPVSGSSASGTVDVVTKLASAAEVMTVTTSAG